MTAALRDRIAELEEEVRQLKVAFAPKVGFPLSWRLDEREAAILSALFNTKGSYVTNEALLLCIAGFDEDVGDSDVRTWIGRLRRKVEARGIAIITRNVQGYALDAAGRALVAEALGVQTIQAPAANSAPAGPAHPRGWQVAEDAIVRAGYARGATLPVIRVELVAAGFRERSISAISTRAHTIGLTNGRAYPNWSPPEDAIVEAAYRDEATLSAIRLLLLDAGFKRNRGAIQMRAIALGVTGDRVKTWSEAERRIVHRALSSGATHAQVIEQLAAAGHERGRTAIARLAADMGFRRAEPEWKPAEDRRLAEFYAAKTPVRVIAQALGRPAGGIASRASKLGIMQRRPRPHAPSSHSVEAAA